MSYKLEITILLQLLTVVLSGETTEKGQVYHITPSPRDPCLEEPCLTLSQFAANPSHYISSGSTTLIFQPGNHSLSNTLNISNVQNFSLDSLTTIKYNIAPFVATTIVCEESKTNVVFQTSKNIEVKHLEFIGCSDIRVWNVNKLILEDTNFLLGSSDNGSMINLYRSRAYILRSNFSENKDGTVLYLVHSAAEVFSCAFSNNSGGVIVAINSYIFVNRSLFYNNSIKNSFDVGVTIYALQSRLIVYESNFSHNSAKASDAAAIYALDTFFVNIYKCHFNKNVAENMAGAVFIMRGEGSSLQDTVFNGNVARSGGALVINKAEAIIRNCLFVNNTARDGGSIFAYVRIFIVATNTTFIGNTACRSGVVHILSGSAKFLNSTTFSRNIGGSLFVFNGNVNITGNSTFVNNSYSSESLDIHSSSLSNTDEGGTVFAFQSTVVFGGYCSMTNNKAEKGGAIHAIQSKLHMFGKLILTSNIAKVSGGGVFLSQSEMTCEEGSRISLTGNSAYQTGGGIHAIGSFINIDFNVHPYSYPWDSATTHYEYLGSFFTVTENSALKGGGVYLEEGAKLYVLKKTEYHSPSSLHDKPLPPIYVLTFALNSAEYGGAVYVSDRTYWGTCASASFEIHSGSSECFLQTLGLHGRKYFNLNLVNTKFEDNHASVSGSTLFGGLLDRCTASVFAEIYLKNQDVSIGGLDYLLNSSNLQSNSESISSYAVRLCFCRDDNPECSYIPPPIHVKKGENFTLAAVAVDQFNETVSNLLIYSYLSSYEGTLGEGQQLQSTGGGCTQLNFSAFSLQSTEELTLYANGPCGDAEKSRLKQQIMFLPCNCPIGFEQDNSDETKCKCKCDHRLEPYITKCDDVTGTVTRKGDFWINYIFEFDGYVTYPHCPLDYCQPSSSSMSISLNSTNGSDAQCSPYRTGMLCGACKSGFSLSSEGSNCVVCPSYWPALLVATIVATLLAGVILLCLMLVLNLTVATGTLSGVIFFANIVNINKNLLFPFLRPNFVTVFISWLNLEIGFDTCFFEGMDAYGKTWLQLLFPLYLVLLVGVVIVLGGKSQRFALLIGKGNPVAVLATLILLSFDKLFHMVIQAFSFAVLDFPNDSNKVVWLPDANINYFQGKHIPLFITALLVLALCIFYTILLFSWQWLLRYQGKTCLRWIRNQKLQIFLKSYHAPYTIRHRYWTGLLLIVRTVLSISSALNMSNNPRLNLLLLGIVMIFLLVFIGRCSPVFENSVKELIEVTFYVNIALLFAFSSFFLEARKQQLIIAYISGTAAIIQFVFAILYHMYVVVLSRTGLCLKLKKVLYRDSQDDELMNYPPILNDQIQNSLTSVTRESVEDEATEKSPLIPASLNI